MWLDYFSRTKCKWKSTKEPENVFLSQIKHVLAVPSKGHRLWYYGTFKSFTFLWMYKDCISISDCNVASICCISCIEIFGTKFMFWGNLFLYFNSLSIFIWQVSCSSTSKHHLHSSILAQETAGFCSVAPSCRARASCIAQEMGSLLRAGSGTTWLQTRKDIFWVELLAKKTQYWQPFPGYPVYKWLPKYLKAVTSSGSAFTHHCCAGGERIEHETQWQGTTGGIVGLWQALLKLFEYSIWENFNTKKSCYPVKSNGFVAVSFTSP